MVYVYYTNMEELWIPLIYDNIENIYKISTMGRIINTKTKKILTGHVDEKGYLQLMLKIKNGRIRKFRMHRLVAMSFLKDGFSINSNTVNHKDGDKLNNFVMNLEWASNEDNIRHAVKTGLVHKGEECHNSNFTDCEVNSICELLQLNKPYDYIISDLNLDDSRNTRVALSRMRRRLSYVHISNNYKWKLPKRLYTLMKSISNEILKGHKFSDICDILNIRPNSVNHDIYRNIINYDILRFNDYPIGGEIPQ